MRLKRMKPSWKQGPIKLNSYIAKLSHKQSSNKYCRKNRIILPDPQTFYQEVFPELEANGEWAKVHCCFHDDKRPSLSLNLESGGFYCFSCQASGGNIITFVMMDRCISFKDALRKFEVAS